MWIVIVLIAIIIGLLALLLWLWLRMQAISRDYAILKGTTAAILTTNIEGQDISNEPSVQIVGGSSSALVNTSYGRMVRQAVTPVDQDTCNACWAIATCQSVSDRLHLKGEILRDQLNYYAFHDIMISETPGMDGCSSGTYLDTGLDMFISKGAPLMSKTRDRNFNDRYIASDLSAKSYKVKRWRELTAKDGYGNIDMSRTISNIKRELETKGSIVGVINLYDSFNYFEGTGVYRPDPSEITDSDMAHMISIVGYDDRDNTWIIRNSYGTSYGYKGYLKIPQGDKRICVEEYVYAPDV